MKLSTKELITCGLFASITSVLSQISIPIPFTTVPLTMQIFAVMLCGMVLGSKLSFISQVIYLLIGAMGVPVFSQMSGGVGAILGPTGGFLLSFPIIALMVGYASEKYKNKIVLLLTMVLALIVSYIIGTLQFSIITNMSFIKSIMACVVPFVFLDLVKIFLAYGVGSTVCNRINIKAKNL